jgi:hypothetical protein
MGPFLFPVMVVVDMGAAATHFLALLQAQTKRSKKIFLAVFFILKESIFKLFLMIIANIIFFVD